MNTTDTDQAKEIATNTPSPAGDGLGASTVGHCPSCGSKNIVGKMAAFWVALGEDGEPKDRWEEMQSETELTSHRECGDCFHEWDVDDLSNTSVSGPCPPNAGQPSKSTVSGG